MLSHGIKPSEVCDLQCDYDILKDAM